MTNKTTVNIGRYFGFLFVRFVAKVKTTAVMPAITPTAKNNSNIFMTDIDIYLNRYDLSQIIFIIKNYRRQKNNH